MKDAIYILKKINLNTIVMPQSKINGINQVNDETNKRLYLQLINEPHCIIVDNA